MFSGVMFGFAVAGFAWGLSLVAYRWIAIQSAWPMGLWQAERPIVPRAIGFGAVTVALVSGASAGAASLLMVLLLGLIGAFFWILLLKVGAQSALLLAPVAVVLMLVGWLINTA